MNKHSSNGIGLMVTLVMMLILLAGVVSAAPVPPSETPHFDIWGIADEQGLFSVQYHSAELYRP